MMNLWYGFWDLLPFEMLHWEFMQNALLAVLLMAPLFGLMSTMIVTGRMSFFSDALGHSALGGLQDFLCCSHALRSFALKCVPTGLPSIMS